MTRVSIAWTLRNLHTVIFYVRTLYMLQTRVSVLLKYHPAIYIQTLRGHSEQEPTLLSFPLGKFTTHTERVLEYMRSTVYCSAFTYVFLDCSFYSLVCSIEHYSLRSNIFFQTLILALREVFLKSVLLWFFCVKKKQIFTNLNN